MNIELKIKRITIAAEARGIKLNENRIRRRIRRLIQLGDTPQRADRAFKFRDHGGAQVASLRSHRLNHVRPEARAMHLAHTFLRGWDYWEVEPISHLHLRTGTFYATWAKLMERVEYHVLKHAKDDPREIKQKLAAWADAGAEYARSAEMQKPALELARRGSLIAKDVRRQAYEREKMGAA